MMTITSSQNPRIKQLLALHEGRERRKSGLYLIEGKRELERFQIASISKRVSCADPNGLEELFIAKGRYSELETWLNEQFKATPKTLVDDALFEKISLRQSPDGVIAIARQRTVSPDQLDWSGPLRLLIAESVEKPGNLGALLRLADGIGAKALILCERTIEIYNPNVIRASMGSFFHIPTLEMSLDELFDFAKEQRIQLVAASPEAETLYTKANYAPRVALAVGAESTGLSERWNDPLVLQVHLPMLGLADSLNVSTAAAVCLYEILRQHQVQGVVQ